jgi:hypothetical protein
MRKTSQQRLLITFLGLFVLAAFAAVARADNSWNGYHWARTSNPFTLKLGDNVSSTWDPILATTSLDWTQSSVLNTAIVTGAGNPRRCRATSGRVEVCNSTYGNNGWLGVASIWVSGIHITQGIVKLNDSYHNFPPYNTTEWRNLVSCQEVGHTLGLDHQDENFYNANLGTCMDYTNNPGPNQHPNQHDYNELASIYGHLDSFTTVSGASTSQTQPPAMNDIDLDGPGQWGKVVKEGKGGKSQTYELDFGGGHKIVTHVIWAEGHERGRGRN